MLVRMLLSRPVVSPRLRAALADPLSKDVMVKVQALTAQPAVNPVLVSTELLKSDIMLVRKFAMGCKVGTEWPLYQSIFAGAAHLPFSHSQLRRQRSRARVLLRIAVHQAL